MVHCRKATRAQPIDRYARHRIRHASQQQRHPGLAEEQIAKPVEPGQPDLPGLDADESDVVADKRALDRLSKPARVYGVNEAMGPEKDILEGF